MEKKDRQLIILAGGMGKRMVQELPKVLTIVGGKPMAERQIENLSGVCGRPLFVVGYKADEVRAALGDRVDYVYQPEQHGTGHAVMCAKSVIEAGSVRHIVVIPGDHPLVSAETIEALCHFHEESEAKLTVAIARVEAYEGIGVHFYNCGRIIRDKSGNVISIIELKDASEEQRKIKELNVSYYCFDALWLWKNIEKLSKNNNAGEYYLTDMVRLAVSQGEMVAGFVLQDIAEGLGVNSPEQKEAVEKVLGMHP